MAGHNNDNAGSGSGSGSGAGAGTGSSSGYITNIWQVLFASLIQLLSRIFRPKSGDTSSKQSPSHPPAAPAPAAPAPATPATPPPHPDASTSDTNHQPAIVITNTDTDAAAAPTTDIDTIAANAANAAPSQQGQYHNDSGLEKGDPSLDEDMAAAKRRGGQKRAATKIANGSNQAANNIAAAPLQQTKENVVPGKLPAQPAASAPFSKPSSTPTPLISKDDNQANSKQHQLPRALNDVSSSGKPRDRQPPTKELDNDDSNNISSAPVAPTNTPSTYAREAPKPTTPQAPPLTAVVPTTNQSEIQSSGSHSADGAQNADPSNLPTTQRVPPNNANMDQATTTLEALTVGDKPGSKPHLDKDTAAIAAAAVPLVVTVPGLKQPMIPKPLAPLVTPP
ncbi:hypothetical protein PG988_006870 [Apiospora saccharicola]